MEITTIYDAIRAGADTIPDDVVTQLTYGIQFGAPWDNELEREGLTRDEYNTGREVLWHRLKALGGLEPSSGLLHVIDDIDTSGEPAWVTCTRCGEPNANMNGDGQCWECGASVRG